MSDPTDRLQAGGIVVIGRNEGERLRRCLQSLQSQRDVPIVYVDSGSTDGSAEMATGLGVWVEHLDTAVPFTMARGRNTGFRRLTQRHPDLAWVQFVDGDCEVEGTWLQKGIDLLRERPDVVAVCGFRRERFPESTTYNRLIDLEWQGPTGEIKACGGDAMYRIEAFAQSGGFNEAMIAGEEPELCVRLRRAGGRIWRIEAKMTIHDAAMTRFSQWWKRSVRCGHAYAEGHSYHGGPPFFHNRKALRSCLLLGLGIPAVWLAAVLVGVSTGGLAAPAVASAAALLVYVKAGWGAVKARLELGNTPSEALLYARYVLLGKMPEALGALRFYSNRRAGKRSTLIEYKAAGE